MKKRPRLTHTAPTGKARMVDVTEKADTAREATATGRITMTAEALKLIQNNELAKGDVLSVARIAGIMAAKRTADLVPLCHPLALTDVVLTVESILDPPSVEAMATVKTVGKTGVEMEAIMAVTIALITVYDMVKSVDRQMTISGVHLLAKSGGRSGSWGGR